MKLCTILLSLAVCWCACTSETKIIPRVYVPVLYNGQVYLALVIDGRIRYDHLTTVKKYIEEFKHLTEPSNDSVLKCYNHF